MKIAHINNTSGIASILSTFQKKQGHEVDVFVFNKLILNQFGGIMINYKSPLARWNLLRKLQREYDIWHYHYPYGSLKRSLEGRNKGKTYLKHYHGDDIRGKKILIFAWFLPLIYWTTHQMENGYRTRLISMR